LFGIWTILDLDAAGYNTTFDENKAELVTLGVELEFKPHGKMERRNEIAWGHTFVDQGIWKLHGDSLRIDYPENAYGGVGLYSIDGDTLQLVRIEPNGKKTLIRLLRGSHTYAELNEPPEPPDPYANLDFTYPPSMRRKQARDFGLLLIRPTHAEASRHEARLGARAKDGSVYQANLYVHPDAGHLTLVVPQIWWRRSHRSGFSIKSLYWISTPDSLMRTAMYDIDFDNSDRDIAGTAKRSNALFDELTQYIGRSAGVPDSIDARPIPRIEEGRTYWLRRAIWQSSDRIIRLEFWPGGRLRCTVQWLMD
jgi:hypothetical protein